MNPHPVPAASPQPHDPPTPLAGGGGPPYDGSMDHRLTVLETRFDTIVPTLLTRVEFSGRIEGLRGDVNTQLATLRGEMNSQFAALRGDTNRDSVAIRGEMDRESTAMRGEMNTMLETMRTEMQALRTDVQGILVSAMNWAIGLAITLIIVMFSLGLAMLNITRASSAMVERIVPLAAPQVVAPARTAPPPQAPH